MKYWFVVVVFLIMMIPVLSFSQGFNLKKYGIEEGLYPIGVYNLWNDVDGNIWIPTVEGPCRFDGKDFIYMDKLKGVNTFCAFQDSRGVMWFGTVKGVFRYDGKDIVQITHKTKDNKDTLLTIYNVFEDMKGNIWASSVFGMFLLKNNTFVEIPVKYRNGMEMGLIMDIVCDRNGVVWFMNFSGYIYKLNEQCFELYRKTEKKTDNFLFMDNAKNIWIISGNKLTKYDGKIEKNIVFEDNLNQYQNTTFSYIKGYDNNILLQRGCRIYKLNNDRFELYCDLCNNDFRKVYDLAFEDRNKNLYFNSDDGLVIAIKTSFKVYEKQDGETNNIIHSFIETKDKGLMCGTNAGLSDNNIKQISNGVFDKLKDNVILKIMVDKKNNIWIGTMGNVSLYEIANNKLIPVIKFKDDLLYRPSINDIYSDNKGVLYFGGRGIFLKYENETFINLENKFSYYWLIYSLNGDKKGNIWIGSNLGVERFDGKILTDYHNEKSLSNLSVSTIAFDKKDYMYLATNNGVKKYFIDKNYKLKYIESITTENGLSTNYIASIIFDSNDNLYIGTDKGINYISSENLEKRDKNIIVFNKKSGLLSSHCIQNAVMKSESGKIYFGTSKGYVEFDSKGIVRTANLIPKITSVKLFHGEQNLTGYFKSYVPYYPEVPVDLILPYDKNHLTFEFNAATLDNPDKIRYIYKLEGFENQWSPANNSSEAVYSNLPPGKYKFMVHAINYQGICSNKPAEFSFEIKPAIWQTVWFWIIIVLISGLGLFFGIRYRIKIIRKQEEFKKEFIELELHTILNQLNPHFIFNSLNSIQSYISNHKHEESQKYLITFSRLMRAILENSKKKHISLTQELSTIELYIKLELLRLNEQFDYFINIQEGINTDEISFPSSLLQPFVENAIWHGLMPKQDKGRLTIDICQKNNLLLCTIEDNGIGREKSEELKKNFIEKHNSSGINIIRKKLDLLNITQKGKHQANINIIDLYDNNKLPAGTRVILEISVE